MLQHLSSLLPFFPHSTLHLLLLKYNTSYKPTLSERCAALERPRSTPEVAGAPQRPSRSAGGGELSTRYCTGLGTHVLSSLRLSTPLSTLFLFCPVLSFFVSPFSFVHLESPPPCTELWLNTGHLTHPIYIGQSYHVLRNLEPFGSTQILKNHTSTEFPLTQSGGMPS